MTAAQVGGAFPVSRPGMVALFPPLPGPVRHALGRLATKVDAPKTGDADADAVELARREAEHAALPRPWIPASCPPVLRRRVWLWLDLVATWLNRDYLWRPDKMIPPCWVAHPHIAHELAVLAFLRHSAENETDPKALEEWHRHALPMFIDRMTNRLTTAQGTQLCDTTHAKWPGLPAYIEFTNDDNQHNRHAMFDHDKDAADQQHRPRRAPDDTTTDTVNDTATGTGQDTVVVDRVTGVVTDPGDDGLGPDDPGGDAAGFSQ